VLLLNDDHNILYNFILHLADLQDGNMTIATTAPGFGRKLAWKRQNQYSLLELYSERDDNVDNIFSTHSEDAGSDLDYDTSDYQCCQHRTLLQNYLSALMRNHRGICSLKGAWEDGWKSLVE